jgi:type I restriction enzyme S subunit
MGHRHKLPETWGRFLLSDVATIQTGLALGKKLPEDIVRLPYLRVANVQDGYFDLREIKEVSVPRDEADRYRLQPGDVLLTEGGDFDKLGRGHIWRGEIDDCLHQNHIFVVRTDRAILDPYYFSLVTNSDYGRSYFLGCAKKSTNLASINSTQLRQMPLHLPPVEDQLAIGKRVITWDRAIDQIRCLIAAKQALKAGLMQQLLTGKRRMRRCAGVWHEVYLRDVTTEAKERNAGRMGAESVKAVNKVLGLIPMRERVIGESLDRYKVVPPKAFAYNPMRLNIGSLVVSDEPNAVLVSPDYVVFTCNEGQLDPGYLDHCRRTYAWRKFVEVAGNGSVRVRIYYKDLGAMKLKLPPFNEQQRIAAVLNACDREIGLLERQLDAFNTQKRGLMQKLLTGQINTIRQSR